MPCEQAEIDEDGLLAEYLQLNTGDKIEISRFFRQPVYLIQSGK